jgi:hypothetical protein
MRTAADVHRRVKNTIDAALATAYRAIQRALDDLASAEVAKIFRVARSTVVGWAKKDLPPYTRTPSGRLRFYRDSSAPPDHHHAGRASIAQRPHPACRCPPHRHTAAEVDVHLRKCVI